ncbi:MAG TPA: 2-oxoglutarate dehydrogenase complex dihydrolipoyllysine-residue succinyltransferase, partial [Stellaceae bacterium]
PRPASTKPAAPPPASSNGAADILARSGPAARKAAAETGVDVTKVAPTGKDGRVTKSDIAAAAAKPAPAPAPVVREPRELGPREERVRMTRLRKRIAERLKDAQNTAAMLTTFNEVDMTEVMALRERYRESFEKQHGVRLGFMSIFAKACIQALKEIPAANAEIDGDDIIYKNHYDLGVAVGTEQGLVVPVVRDADQLSFAEIEKRVADLGRRARDGKLSLDELSGGTFTITNGGVYGSLLSTPILNPPQSAILGMHKIQKRPVVIGDKIEARPMMYLALSYDHRMIDGREAVTFLVRVKECIEDPQRMLFGI